MLDLCYNVASYERPRAAKAADRLERSAIGKKKTTYPRPGLTEEEELEQAFQEITGKPTPEAAPAGKKTRSGGAFARQTPSDTIRRNRIISIIAICCACVVLLIGILMGGYYYLLGGPDNGLILQNVSAAGISLGGMTPEEAKGALERATADTYTKEPMVIVLPDEELELSPADTGAKLDVTALVEAAYGFGRTGSLWERREARLQAQTTGYIIPLLPYLNLDTGYIKDTLVAYEKAFNTSLTQPTVKLDHPQPSLSPGSLDPDYKGTLLLTMGTPGRELDFNALYNEVIDAYSLNTFLITKECPVVDPETPDVEALYKEFCVDPVDAVMDMRTFEVKPETYGFGFDKATVEKMIRGAEFGQVLEIPIGYVEPEILGSELEALLFRDVLASASTYQYSGYNRSTNLRLACEAINGVVIMPGEIFSYNDTLGERTPEKGYLPAGSYMGTEIVDTYGGGICQVSSTLYYCSLYADLEIVERWYHTYNSDYLPLGMDATVNWGTLDYCFRNNTNYPIRIDAYYDDEGNVNVALIGTDEKDYYVVMDYSLLSVLTPEDVTQTMKEDNPKGYTDGEVIQYPMYGYIVETYKYKYDKATNELISCEYEDYSEYEKRDYIICKIEKPTEPPTEPTTQPPVTVPPTQPPTEVPTQAPTEAPTEAPTQAPTEAPTQAVDPTATTAP